MTIDRSTPISRERAKALEMAAWDAIAPQRAADLAAGKDPSYKYVLSPGVLSLIPTAATHVLDVGCGVGRLTKMLAKPSRYATGIDPSQVSTDIAREYTREDERIKIHNLTIEQYVGLGYTGHDAAVALMVMQDVVDLQGFLGGCSAALKSGGSFVAAITHPVHWPDYWGYSKEPWFDVSKEIYIESQFRTSWTNSGIKTLHVHRPQSAYISALEDNGFHEIDSWAPMMPRATQKNLGIHWKSPHFWFLRARKR